MFMSYAKSEGLDQPARMRRLIKAFPFREYILQFTTIYKLPHAIGSLYHKMTSLLLTPKCRQVVTSQCISISTVIIFDKFFLH